MGVEAEIRSGVGARVKEGVEMRGEAVEEERDVSSVTPFRLFMFSFTLFFTFFPSSPFAKENRKTESSSQDDQVDGGSGALNRSGSPKFSGLRGGGCGVDKISEI